MATTAQGTSFAGPAVGARRAGFSLIELLVTLGVIAVAMLAVLAIFDSSNRLARVQGDVADLQQNLRIGQQDMVRLTRMAGRGGLAGAPPQDQTLIPLAAFPPGTTFLGAWQAPALEVRNNVTAANRRIDLGGTTAPAVNAVLGTDVLTVRGSFTNPIYWLNYGPGAAPFNAATRTILVSKEDPSGIDRTARLAPLLGAAGQALLVVSGLDSAVYGVALINAVNDIGTDLQITYFDGSQPGDPPLAQQMARLSNGPGGGVFPPLTKVSHVALLEEYRYFVREANDIDGNLRPTLTRAQMLPGTEVPFQNSAANLRIDVADSVYDLQVALGFDSALAGGLNQNPVEAPGPDPFGVAVVANVDDWLFNDATDLTASPATWQPNAGVFAAPPPRLHFARVSVLALAPRADPTYMATLITAIEDGVPPVFVDSTAGLRRRRQLMQTLVDLRNVS
jgi:prepilin-type N-terminal cleavage/methylation domain-containing protein